MSPVCRRSVGVGQQVGDSINARAQCHALRTLHLCAGAGGGILADQLLGHRTVCAVEIDPYCQQVLLNRQADGSLPWFPLFGDVCAFDGRPWHGCIDICATGFPCQPFSLAGRQRGAADPRHLWPDIFRVVCEVRPGYVFVENTPGLLADPLFGVLLGDVASAGYDAVWCVLGADDLGAPHHRKRLWLLAYDRRLCETLHGAAPPGSPGAHDGTDRAACARGDPAHLEHPARERLALGESQRADVIQKYAATVGASWWAREPAMDRVVDGMAGRVDRIKALGRGQIPLVAATAWRILSGHIRAGH